jgi:BON domain
MANQNPWRDAPLSGDDLYGDRENLRRYRDFARDEHRRFAAQSEHERQGGIPFRDRFSEYDNPQTDLTRGAYASPGRRHATEGGYAYGLGERPKPQRPHTQEQSHRGRGPRGYQRADQSIYEDICERFTEDEHIDASEIEIQVKEGEVTLTGTLRSRNSKRWAGDLAEQVSGVKDVHNLIRVVDEQVWPPRRATPG